MEPKSWLSGKLKIDALLAFAFGAILLLLLLILAVAISEPTLSQQQIFRIMISLAAACVAAVIPGLLNFSATGWKGIGIKATGALAVFIVVYLINPAQY